MNENIIRKVCYNAIKCYNGSKEEEIAFGGRDFKRTEREVNVLVET